MNKHRPGYFKEYYEARKTRARDYLGGVCVQCGTDQNLEFDHIDPNNKRFGITNNLLRAWDVVQNELDKCQLLCYDDHKRKTFSPV